MAKVAHTLEGLAPTLEDDEPLHTDSWEEGIDDEERPCSHIWSYTGVRFRNGKWPMEGDASIVATFVRYYGQHYLCTKCATTRIDRLPEATSTTAYPILYNASPATEKEFPIEDERGH